MIASGLSTWLSGRVILRPLGDVGGMWNVLRTMNYSRIIS